MSTGGLRTTRFAWERALLDAQLGRKDDEAGKSGRLSTGFIGLAVATYAGRDGGNIYPGQNGLAARLGCSVRTVQHGLAELERLGFLTKVGAAPSSSGRAQEYRLSIPTHTHPVAGAPPPDDTHPQPVARQQTIYLSTYSTGKPVDQSELTALAAAVEAGAAGAAEALARIAPPFEPDRPAVTEQPIAVRPESLADALDPRQVRIQRGYAERDNRDQNLDANGEPLPRRQPTTRRLRR